MSEKFSLKWNDFQANVTKRFSQLRSKEDYYDVTLVSSDQQNFQAHKIILSACSPYFDNILKTNTTPISQLVLCLENISSKDLNNILDYIYNGEAQILESDLNDFLSLAERFKLEGLSGMENEEENNDNITEFKDVNEFKEETFIRISEKEDIFPVESTRTYQAQERRVSHLTIQAKI